MEQSNEQKIAQYVHDKELVPLISLKTRFIHVYEDDVYVVSGSVILEIIKHPEKSEMREKILKSCRLATLEEDDLGTLPYFKTKIVHVPEKATPNAEPGTVHVPTDEVL